MMRTSDVFARSSRSATSPHPLPRASQHTPAALARCPPPRPPSRPRRRAPQARLGPPRVPAAARASPRARRRRRRTPRRRRSRRRPLAPLPRRARANLRPAVPAASRRLPPLISPLRRLIRRVVRRAALLARGSVRSGRPRRGRRAGAHRGVHARRPRRQQRRADVPPPDRLRRGLLPGPARGLLRGQLALGRLPTDDGARREREGDVRRQLAARSSIPSNGKVVQGVTVFVTPNYATANIDDLGKPENVSVAKALGLDTYDDSYRRADMLGSAKRVAKDGQVYYDWELVASPPPREELPQHRRVPLPGPHLPHVRDGRGGPVRHEPGRVPGELEAGGELAQKNQGNVRGEDEARRPSGRAATARERTRTRGRDVRRPSEPDRPNACVHIVS